MNEKISSLEIDSDLAEMFAGVLGEYRESGSDLAVRGKFDPELWQMFDELGIKRLTGAEELGGSGAGWAEAKALISALAHHGVRSPYAEHDLLAGFLAEQVGVETGELMTVCEFQETSEGLVAKRVPWASAADRVIVIVKADRSRLVHSVASSELLISEAFNNIGESRDTVRLPKGADLGAGKPLSDEVYGEFKLKQAMVRAIATSAALKRALEMSIKHVTERKQFGRALAKFQAVQNLVADMAAESALAEAAVDAALIEGLDSGWSGEKLEFLVAVARSSVGHSASVVVRNAHQAHGAIGTTLEHELHRSTRAALAWRGEYGSVNHWDNTVKDIALAAGDKKLWSLIAG